MNVFQLRKRLRQKEEDDLPAEVEVRSFAPSTDIERWLQLRNAEFKDEKHPVRPWTAADFALEMTSRPWRRDDRCWLAFANDQCVRSVTLAMRRDVPVVHWLMVHPDWRRRGIARALLATLEQAAWDDGYREVHLETHAGWQAALACYQKLGYEEVIRTRRPST